MAAKSQFETCVCNNCDGHIEFPSDHIGETIQCPHCGVETRLYKPNAPVTDDVPPVPPAAQAPPPVPPNEQPQTLQKATPSAQPGSPQPEAPVLLRVFAVLLFLIGGGLILNGCMSGLEETMRTESSAIRQIVYVLQYGAGFIVVALSCVLAALCRLIQKR